MAEQQAGEGYGAVFFMDGADVARQMRESEFAAFLDGYVGLSDLANTDVQAVYMLLTPDLGIRSLVFFRIHFDGEGRADSRWNVPIEKLASTGAPGPDLGNGPIRLVCRSQCPQPEFASTLWDPDMTPHASHFQSVRKAIEKNTLKFRKQVPQAAGQDVPVLQSMLWQSASDRDRQRTRLARTIREQRLRIKTLQSVQRDALKDVRSEHRLELKDAAKTIQHLEGKLERQLVASDQLRAQLDERNEHCLELQQRLEKLGSTSESREQSSSAELVLLREQLERKQMALKQCNDEILLLTKERDDVLNREPPEQSLLGQIKAEAVFLVAYHAGAGHITLRYDDIDRYFDNPVAFAAQKHDMNESAYRCWIAHFEAPVCQAKIVGKKCGKPVLRVSRPSAFQPGVDDWCEEHQLC